MKIKFIPALLAVVIAGRSCHAAVLLLNTVDDFSTVAQSTNGLEYGYYTSADQLTGTFSTAGMSVISGQWTGPEAFDTPQFSALSQHPGVSLLYPAVRRYTVGSGGEPAYTGLVQITGLFGGGPAEGGGSVIGFITVDGINLFSSPADGAFANAVNFDFLAQVSPGSTIDFGVAANGDPSFDLTNFSAAVFSVPEPSRALLVSAGLACAVFRRVRRVRSV